VGLRNRIIDDYFGIDLEIVWTILTTMRVLVENQAVLGDDTPVAAVLARLVDQGLTPHEAVPAVGAALSGVIHDVHAFS
jgi:hypothetical protein